jgi:histidine kinase/DNA gyrase B/HSP90-like ATPase
MRKSVPTPTVLATVRCPACASTSVADVEAEAALAAAGRRPVQIEHVRGDRIGMPPEVLKTVGRNRARLGVANCQRLIGCAGGRMRIESEQGVGTTLTILLPSAA